MKLLVLAGLAVAVAAVAAGCGHASSAPAPTGTPSATGPTPPTIDQTIGRSAGSDGLTVRYRDPDGGLKTLRVEDFHR